MSSKSTRIHSSAGPNSLDFDNRNYQCLSIITTVSFTYIPFMVRAGHNFESSGSNYLVEIVDIGSASGSQNYLRIDSS